MSEIAKAREILNFWFQGVDDSTVINKKAPPFSQWFTKDPSFDQQIKDRFEEDLKNAASHEPVWGTTPRGSLALVILCDQFSRNIYRDIPKMYDTDPQALSLSVKLIKGKEDQRLSMIERVFVYLPFMHAEDMGMQRESVQLFKNLVMDSKHQAPYNVNYFENNLF